MEQIIKQLKTIYWSIVGGVLLFAFLVEFVLMDEVGGVLTNDKQSEFLLQSFSILLSLASIYFSLRLFKFKKIEATLRENPLANYMRYSVLRLVMIEVPLLFNIVCYMLFVNTSFSWLGVIVGLSFPFVYPNKERFLSETGYQEK